MLEKIEKILYRLWIVIYPVLMTGLFAVHLSGFHVEQNIFFLLLLAYCFSVYTFFFMYFGNKVGTYRIVEIVYSNTLGLIISNVLFFIVLMIVVGQPFSVFRFILMFVVQVLVTVLWTVISNSVQLKVYGSHRIVLVHGENKKPEIIKKKLDNRKNRFFIEKIVNENVGISNVLKECSDIGTIMIYGVKQEINVALTKLCYEDNRQLC